MNRKSEPNQQHGAWERARVVVDRAHSIQGPRLGSWHQEWYRGRAVAIELTELGLSPDLSWQSYVAWDTELIPF